MLPRFAERIGLSDAQLDQVEAIVDAREPELEALHDQATAARDAFRDAHEIGDFDEAEFRTHFSSQAQIHVEMKLIGAEMMSQAWDVLTAEQQQELLELLELFKPGDGRGQGAGTRHGGGKRLGAGR
jgi:Spy/CpxP family protein refolding chaperone